MFREGGQAGGSRLVDRSVGGAGVRGKAEGRDELMIRLLRLCRALWMRACLLVSVTSSLFPMHLTIPSKLVCAMAVFM